MTRDNLKRLIDAAVEAPANREILLAAVDVYSESQNSGKPIVSGSLGLLVQQAKDVAFADAAAEQDARRLYILNEIGDRLVECLELISDLKANDR